MSLSSIITRGANKERPRSIGSSTMRPMRLSNSELSSVAEGEKGIFWQAPVLKDYFVPGEEREDQLVKKQVMVVDASAPIKTVKKMAITDILPRVFQMPVEKQKPKKVGGVVR